MESATLKPQNPTTVLHDNSLQRIITNDVTNMARLTNTEIFLICMYFFILITGVIGNGLVIFVTGYKMKKTVNSVWFLNLAIADFIFILFLVREIFVAFNNETWPFGDFLCKGVFFLKALNMFASVFFLTVISLDRCLCTWLMVWTQNRRTLVKARIVCVIVWLLSICCSAPFATISSIHEFKEHQLCGIANNDLTSLFIFMFIMGFLIPFLIIAFSYVAIGVRVKQLKTRKRLKPFRVLSVILAFFICWFPFHVFQLSYVIGFVNENVQEIAFAAKPYVNCLAYLNSCLNPILYVFMCEEYKKKLKTSLLLVFEAAFAEENLGFCKTSLELHSPQSQTIANRQTDVTASSSDSDQQDRTRV